MCKMSYVKFKDRAVCGLGVAHTMRAIRTIHTYAVSKSWPHDPSCMSILPLALLNSCLENMIKDTFATKFLKQYLEINK